MRNYTDPVSNLSPGHDVNIGVIQQGPTQILMLGEVTSQLTVVRLQTAHLRTQDDDVICHPVHGCTVVLKLLGEKDIQLQTLLASVVFVYFNYILSILLFVYYTYKFTYRIRNAKILMQRIKQCM